MLLLVSGEGADHPGECCSPTQPSPDSTWTAIPFRFLTSTLQSFFSTIPSMSFQNLNPVFSIQNKAQSSCL